MQTSKLFAPIDPYSGPALLRRVLVFSIPVNLIIQLVLVRLLLATYAPQLVFGLLLTIWHLAVLCWAWYASTRGQLERAAFGNSLALITVSIIAGQLVPQSLPVLVVLCLSAIFLALPYLAARTIRWLLILDGVALVLKSLPLWPAPLLLGPRDSWALPLVLGVTMVSLLYQLWVYHNRLHGLIAQTESANQALRAAYSGLETEVHARTAEAVAGEARYRTISELTSDFVYAARIEPGQRGTIDWITEAAFSRIMGYTLDEFEAIGGWRAVVHPEDLPLFREKLQLAVGGVPQAGEFRITTKAGTSRWLRANVRIEPRLGGRLIGAIKDITEEKLAALAQQASEARFRAVIEAAPLGIVIVHQGVIRYANPQCLAMFGYTQPGELVGQAVAVLVTAEQRPLVLERGRRRDAGQPAETRYETVGQQLNGQPFPLQVDVARIEIAAGWATLAFLSDLTERQRAEHERLEIERKLLESQKLESLGVLAGGVAHDFNNLLTVVIGNTNLAQVELPAESSAYELLVQVELAARRAADLTRQMLAYAGKGPLLVGPIDLNTLISETLLLVRSALPDTTRLVHRLTELPALYGDATQLQQVVMNLLLNAAEAIGERGGQIVITTEGGEVSSNTLEACIMTADGPPHAGYYAQLSVSDTGIGMDATTLSRIFEPFFTTKFTGRGLGLAAVMGIVQGHQGALSVESTPGVGTTFRLFLPVAP